MLVLGHVALDGHTALRGAQAVGLPPQGCLQKVLPYGRSVHEQPAHVPCGAVRLREIAFSVGHEGSGINRIAQFLLGESLACNVDGLKPVELFFVVARADVDEQLVVENLVLLRRRQVVEILEFVGKVAVHILTDRNGALLSVHHFVGHLAVVVARGPVHHVQRKPAPDGGDDGVALFLVVDKFALIGWANVESSAKSPYASFLVVLIARSQLTNRDFSQFYLHFICV